MAARTSRTSAGVAKKNSLAGVGDVDPSVGERPVQLSFQGHVVLKEDEGVHVESQRDRGVSQLLRMLASEPRGVVRRDLHATTGLDILPLMPSLARLTNSGAIAHPGLGSNELVATGAVAG